MTTSTHVPHLVPPDNYEGPRRALILAGGGMRVSYQAGVLRALEESGKTFQHFDGTSGGIINTAMLFSGLSPTEMCDRWKTVKPTQFFSLPPMRDLIRPLNMPALADADGVIDSAFPHLGIDVPTINAAEGAVATFNVCDYGNKLLEAVPHTRVELGHLVAGISLPGLMPPVEIGGTTYIDGVWIKDANLMEAVRRGADELWLVWCIGNHDRYLGGLLNQYVHMIEMSANGALIEEFDRIKEINERIERGEVMYGRSKPIRLHIIEPEYPLPLDTDLYLGRIDNAMLIDMGYADAHRYLRTAKEEGLEFTPEVIKMKSEPLGIAFRETMSGGFSLGAEDPIEGKKAGDLNHSTLSMHASIAIRDLNRFIADPDHLGEITGRIDFTPWGTDISAKTGVFNLFSPTDKPDTKYMVYEMGFEVDGTDYYLAGHKNVHNDPGFDLWADTTTLFTTLHQSTDKSGPIIGAGVLSLGVTDLARLVSTTRVTGEGSPIQKSEAISEFGVFFAGELWDLYGKRYQGFVGWFRKLFNRLIGRSK